MGELLVMMTMMISPFGREVPQWNRSAEGQKCSCPSSASRWRRFVPNVLPLFFEVNMTYIPEDGHQRWAWVSTTHQGAPGLPGTPRCVVPTWWAPSGTYLLQ